MRFNAIIILFLLFTTFKSVFAANCLLLALSNYSNSADIFRTGEIEQFWSLYKNDPRFEVYIQSRVRQTDLDLFYDSISSKQATQSQSIANTTDSTAGILNTATVADPTATAAYSNPVNLYDAGARGLSDVEKMDMITNEIYQHMREYRSLSDEARDILPPTQPRSYRLNLSFEYPRYSPEGEMVKTCLPGFGACTRRLQAYERDLNLLKSGDTVVFDSVAGLPEKSFTINRYLGAGNSTHIYEITSETGEATVLRLPNIADFLGTRNRKIFEDRRISTDGRYLDPIETGYQRYQVPGITPRKRLQTINDKDYRNFHFSRRFVKNRDNSICNDKYSSNLGIDCYYTVKILSHDPNYRWIEVEKLNIEGDAKEFIDANAQVVQMLQANKTNIQISRSLSGIQPHEVDKIRQRYERLKAIEDLARLSGASDFHPGQLTWARRPDTNEYDWILTDW